MELRNFDVGRFLRESWQKRPCLIRNPWASWTNPLAPDELAGLACESEVESRLITQGAGTWDVEHGPIAASRFDRMGRKPWTLLVQAVDHQVPAVAALLEQFRFIPNWRIDDVMVSYAVAGGGVGPHFDHYDVFLVQGLGRRRWQVGGLCDDATELLPHDDLRLLADFQPTDEWTLEPGDILYVPPGFAHDGVAVGDDCMTYSVGFRAPSRGELMTHWTESLAAELLDADRYSDPDLSTQENPGEISPGALDRLHAMVTEKMSNRAEFARWFGHYSTTPKNPEIEWHPEEPVHAAEARRLLTRGVALLRNPAGRFSFIRENAVSLWLFVDGECFACIGETAAFAEQVCAKDRLVGPEMADSEPTVSLIVALLNQGSLAFEQDD